MASVQSAFPRTEVSAFPNEIHLERSDFGSRHFKTTWQPGYVYVMSFCLTLNWQEVITLTSLSSLNAIILDSGTCLLKIIQLESRVVIIW